jgi:hypothetical protein
MLSTTIKIAVLTVAAAGMLVAPVTADDSPTAAKGPAKGSKAASVSGTAQVRLTYWPDQDIRTFTFNAQAVPYSMPKPGFPNGLATDARGTVKISHHSPQGEWTVEQEAAVDCLVTSPGNATLTAIVTWDNHPTEDWVGKRYGFSVHDGGNGGHDRMGFSWSVVNGIQNENGEWEEGKPGTCMGPAAFAPVTKGGYAVKHADLLPDPGTG